MIVLNAQARRERPVPPPIKVKKKTDLFTYLAHRCETDAEYDMLRDALMDASQDIHVAFDASTLDEALVWSQSPQGSEFWAHWHDVLENRE